MKTALSVVVPCYNEAESLEGLAKRFASCSPEKRGFELLLVDNGSSDGSSSIMRALAKSYRFIRIATVKKNEGYGNGILAGLRDASGEYLCFTHADLQADPLDSVRAYQSAIKAAHPQNCYVKGRRQNRPASDAFFTFGMSVFAALVLGRWLTDINAQPNLFHRSFLAKLKSPPKDFSFDLYCYFMAEKLGMKTIRIPVDFSRRLHGQSHWNNGILGKWKFIKRTAAFIIGLRLRLEGS